MLLLVLAMADTVSGIDSSSPPAAPVAAVAAPPSASSQPAPPQPGSATMVPAATPSATTVPAASTAPATDPVSAAATSDPVTSPDPASSTESPSSSPSPDPAAPSAMSLGDAVAQPRDPWVKVNRSIFKFDIALERHLLAPVAHGYNHVVPHAVRYHVTNALFNLGEPLTAVNDLLQLRIGAMGRTVFRFVVNSTIGIAGLFDVAKSSGVPIHISDFGQTLGRYGVKPGPYVMIPLLGPSNLRDGFGRIVDNFTDPVEFFIGGITSPEGLSLFVLEGVDWRSRADDTMKAVYSATDPYAFVRSAYSQSRAATVAQATGKPVALPDFDAPPGP